jgi:hypothetical protein
MIGSLVMMKILNVVIDLSSNEFDEQKSDNLSKRNKKKMNMNLIEGFSEKRFKVIMNESIIFEECQLLSNVNHFKDVLRKI